MNLTSQTIGDMLVIRVEDNRIDAAKAIQFKDKMRNLTQNDMPRILLDMTEVLFLDSSGLGAVVAVMKHLNPARHLELCHLNPAVQKVFRLTRMDSVFTIHPEVPDAVARLQAK